MSNKEMTFVTVRMPSDLVEKIDELAKDEIRNRSSQIIYMLRQFLSDLDSESEYY